jgi:hypothetical protein
MSSDPNVSLGADDTFSFIQRFEAIFPRFDLSFFSKFKFAHKFLSSAPSNAGLERMTLFRFIQRFDATFHRFWQELEPQFYDESEFTLNVLSSDPANVNLRADDTFPLYPEF